jgi:hypothetical protein
MRLTGVGRFPLLNLAGGSQKNAEGPGGGDSHHDSVVSGEVSFRIDSTKATAKFCKVSDRRRLHRYQEPQTNPHLLRFLLEVRSG